MEKKTVRQKISVVIPVMNENESIEILNSRLFDTLSPLGWDFELIYVDDHSTDGTFEILQTLDKIRHVRVFTKQGEPGKAYSLLEGFAKATGSIFVMIDGDLQYPPEAIPDMLERLGDSDIVVANRKDFSAPILRKVASRIFKKMFGELLFGLKTDVQSGLKVFTRRVYETVHVSPKSPWTFDLEFLFKAREAGFSIANHDIAFVKRPAGNSHIRFLRQSAEIAGNALRVRLVRPHPLIIPPESTANMVGAGIGYKNQQYITHTTLPHEQTALRTLSRNQLFLLWMILVTLWLSIIIQPLSTVRVMVGILSIVYFIDVVFNLFIVLRSLTHKQELTALPAEIEILDNTALPVYSILCPLYKEAAILPQFLAAIEKIDWPKAKLDVLLLLEEDDTESIDITKDMQLPSYVRSVIVPHSHPKTKPKACNYGLNLAKGEYIVIYDAEDIPDPQQLKKAYLGFQNSQDDLVCLQAKLNYYNPNQNLLTRFFTAEYSLWFDVTLTGFQSINTSIPLGGTSNHFKTAILRTLHGWDTFNVTEDADLGIRLFKHGYNTAIIDSITLEEANSNLRNWIRQRSRWLKGYMQSYLVHMRNFMDFVKMKGIHAIIFQMVIGSKLVFIFLNPLLWILTTLYFTFRSQLGPTIELMYIAPVFYLAAISLIFGNFLFLYYYLAGTARRKQWELMKYVLFIPIYWLLISIAGWVAFYQLLFKPHYWEKTIHGLHLKKTTKKQTADPATESITPKPENAWYPVPRPAFVGTFFRSIRLIRGIIINNTGALASLFKSKPMPSTEKKKPAILIFNWRDTKHVWAGGAEVYIDEIAKRWAAEGNTVMIFCGNDGHSPQQQVLNGVHITRSGGLYTVYLWAFFYYLFVFRGKYDVIIDCENGIPFFTPFYTSKPIFLLIHHVHQEVFREHLKFPFSAFARLLESVCMPLFYRNRPVITVSDSSKTEILKLGFSHAENISIVHNGIRHELFAPGEKTPNPTFLYLGRLKPYKNVDTALLAFSTVLKKYPEAHFHVVGEGESKWALKKLTRKLQLKESVTFHGRVTEKEKARLLSQSWAMLQPSMVEGWGITVIEANASGTPVIAARVNGLKDSVVDGQTGRLVNPGDSDEFARVMLEMIENPASVKELSTQAVVWAQQFTWDKSAILFYSLIQSALPKKAFTPAYGSIMVADTK